MPGKHGDHDIKVGVQYQYSGAVNANQGNLNGTFAFGRSNAPFNAADPATYPDRFTHPRRRAEHLLREGALRLRRSCRTSGASTSG